MDSPRSRCLTCASTARKAATGRTRGAQERQCGSCPNKHTPGRVVDLRTLFREYADWLNVDLCFQDFEAELARLPGEYAPPKGRAVLNR